MKLHFLLRALAIALGCLSAAGQTPEELIAQGRAFLVARDYVKADERFVAALVVAPAHETANVFRGLSRVLALPERPAVKSMLDQLGVKATNRNLLHWAAGLPTDTNGIPFAPAGLSAQTVTDSWRTHVVPELVAAAGNFSRVSDPGYLLALTAGETTTVGVTVDYADVQMLRALCQGAAYVSLTLHEWNWDAQLASVRDFATNHNHSAEAFLAAHPQLFAFDTAADLVTGREAFVGLTANYLVASELIQARPLTVDRLFNRDDGQLRREAGFRQALSGLRDSLDGPRAIHGLAGGTVQLGKQFTGGFALRSWLPMLSGNSFVLGTLPDPSLGGLLQGFGAPQIEEFLTGSSSGKALGLPAVSRLGIPEVSQSKLHLRFSVLRGRAYGLEASEDLRHWQSVGTAVGQSETVEFDVPPGEHPGFYRIHALSRPPNDDYAGRVRLEGQNAEFSESFEGTGRESGEPQAHSGFHTLWWEWTAPEDGWVVLEDASGGNTSLAAYLPPSFFGMVPVLAQNIGSRRMMFEVPRGQTYMIAAGNWNFDGRIHLRLSQRPRPSNDFRNQAQMLAGENAVADGYLAGATAEAGEGAHGGTQAGPSVWYRWTAPSSGRYRLTMVSSNGGAFDVYQVSGNEVLIKPGASGTGVANIDVAKDVTLLVAVYPSYGLAPDFRIELKKVIPPPNDDFAQAAVLVGASASYTGNVEGAGRESGEPYHANPLGQAGGTGDRGTVWFLWTAPESGVVDISVSGNAGNAIAIPYVGADLAHLVPELEPDAAIEWSPIRFRAVGGTTYHFAMEGMGDFGGALGAYRFELVLRNPVTNDDFSQRIPILEDHATVAGDNGHATVEAGEPSKQFASVWWSWKAPANGILRLQVSRAGFYPTLTLFSGTQLADLVTIQGAGSIMQQQVVGGVSYAIRVDDHGDGGRFLLGLDFQAVEPVANDAMANGTILSGVVVHAAGGNVSASKELGEPAHAGNSGGKSVWWTWTAPGNTTVTIDTFGSSFDTVLAVYTGAQVGGLSQVSANDDAAGGHTSQVKFSANAGVSYRIAVDGFAGSSGTIVLNLVAVPR